MANEPIQWLHISDLHMRNSDTVSRNSLDKLPDYLTKIQNTYGQIKYLFLTGDLIFAKGNTVSTEEVKNYVLSLAKIINIPADNICIIPGNHDIIKTNEAETSAIQTAYNSYLRNHSALKEGCIDKSVYSAISNTMNRFDELYRSIYGDLHYDFTKNPHFVRELEDICVLHLNTAFLQKETGLVIDVKKVETALRNAAITKPLFVIGHHPIELLIQEEGKRLKNLLIDHHAIVYMCGHQHVNELSKIEVADRKGSIIETMTASGLDNTDALEMGFQIGTYDIDRDYLSIKAFEWKPRRANWYPDISFCYQDAIADVPGYETGLEKEINALRRFFDHKNQSIVRNGVYDDYINRVYCIKPDSCSNVFWIDSAWNFKLVDLYHTTTRYYFSINLPIDNDFEIKTFTINDVDMKNSIEFRTESDDEHHRIRKEFELELSLNDNHAAIVNYEFCYKEALPVLYLHSSYMYPAKKRSINIHIEGDEAKDWIVNASTFSSFRNVRATKPPYEIKKDEVGISEIHKNNYYSLNAEEWTLPGFGYAFAVTKKEHTAVCWRQKEE